MIRRPQLALRRAATTVFALVVPGLYARRGGDAVLPFNSVVRVVELPKRCRIRPRRPRRGRRRLSRAELAPHLMPGNQPSHGLRARHQLYLPRQLGAGAAVSPHKRASHAAQAAAAAPPPHPRGRGDRWSCHNSYVAAPTLFTAAPGRFYGPAWRSVVKGAQPSIYGH